MRKAVALTAASVLALTACGGKSEQERVVDLSVDLACHLSDYILAEDPQVAMEELFAKHGFEGMTQEEFQTLTEKYKDDAEMAAAIEAAVSECLGETTPTDEEAMEEEGEEEAMEGEKMEEGEEKAMEGEKMEEGEEKAMEGAMDAE